MKEELEIKQIDNKDKVIQNTLKESNTINANSKNETIMSKEIEPIKQKENSSKNEELANSDEIKRCENKNKDEKTNNPNKTCCDENCIPFFFLITTILLSISIFPNIILLIGMLVSNSKNKECKAEIYPEMRIIVGFEGMLIALAGINQSLKENETERCEICLKIISPIIFKIITFGISLACVLYTQIYYNNTTSWENCGSVKGWIIYGLVINYIEVITNSVGFIFAIIFIFILIFCRDK